MSPAHLTPLLASISDYVDSSTLFSYGGPFLAIVILGWMFWRLQLHKNRLVTAYNTREKWNAVLSQDSAFNSLTGNPEGLVTGTPEFTNGTREAHDKAKVLWANYLAYRSVGKTRLESVDAKIKQVSSMPIWQVIFTRRLQEAIDTMLVGEATIGADVIPDAFASLRPAFTPHSVPVAELLDKVQVCAGDSTRELRRIADAITAARATIKDIERQISGTDDSSIASLKKALNDRSLSILPYERRFENVDTLVAGVSRELISDPLKSHKEEVESLKNKIELFRRRLQRGLDLHAQCTSCNQHLTRLKDRVAELRRTPVPASIPELRINSTYTLDEPEFVIGELLAEAEGLQKQLEAALAEAANVRFNKLHTATQDALVTTERLLNTALEAQTQVDRQFGEITAESTAADLQADREERQEICDLYSRQHWHAASKPLAALASRHLLRKTARKEVAALVEDMREFGERMRAETNITSETLDADGGNISAQVTQLKDEGDQGQANWRQLMENVAAAQERLSTLSDRLNAEITQHASSMVAVGELAERAEDLRSRVADRWGGEEAARQLAELQAAITAVADDARRSKQPWVKLEETAKNVLASTQGVRDRIYAEVSQFNTLQAALSALTNAVSGIEKGGFTREICSVCYGLGLYVPTAEVSESLRQAGEALESRDYNTCDKHRQQANQTLQKLNLEAWWLALQMMAESDEPCARVYAHQHGYADGRFEQWFAGKAAAPADWSPPVVTYNSHVGAKPHVKVLPVRVFDEPPSSDYEGHYAEGAKAVG